MDITTFFPIIKAALVSLLMGVLASFGLDIPQSVVQETVEAGLEDWQERGADSSTQAPLVAAVPARVTQVIDGDTVVVLVDDKEAKVRFIGIDTPETEHSPVGAECYGAEATARARELLQDQTIMLRTDETQALQDVHGRLLAYAELPNERDFGEVMLAEGLAREYTYARAYAQQQTYQAAQAAARQAGTGLWAACEGG